MKSVQKVETIILIKSSKNIHFILSRLKIFFNHSRRWENRFSVGVKPQRVTLTPVIECHQVSECFAMKQYVLALEFSLLSKQTLVALIEKFTLFLLSLPNPNLFDQS